MKNVIIRAIRKVVSAAAAVTMAFAGFAYTATATVTTASAAETTEYAAMADEIVMLVNEARTAEGLAPVAAVPVINDAAAVRASEAVELFSHTRPNGNYFHTILLENNVRYALAGENIAAGSDNAADTFEQWKNSPGHWANIMNPKYTHIGVGVTYVPGSDYEWYWTQLFISSNDTLEGQYIPGTDNTPNVKYAPTPVIYGDVDGSGAVNSFDLVLLLKSLTNETTLTANQLKSADCMQDEKISIADAIVIKKYILGQYDTLPVSL